ncbi:hypothetical protein Tco_1044128 [Tanacetum coccineum]|uniref:Uncharacterized protein n=1 Tax=Tanacetum coccineum TaxID=301880 RepID=A0ABQ5GPG8_9ASTR
MFISLNLVFPLDAFRLVIKLHVIEDPVKIIDHEVNQLKQSRIPIVKVYWNSCQRPEFTWEREDQFKAKYSHLFVTTSSAVGVAVVIEESAHELLTFRDAIACEAEIWVTKGLLDEAKEIILGMEVFRFQSSNALRVLQFRFSNGMSVLGVGGWVVVVKRRAGGVGGDKVGGTGCSSWGRKAEVCGEGGRAGEEVEEWSGGGSDGVSVWMVRGGVIGWWGGVLDGGLGEGGVTRWGVCERTGSRMSGWGGSWDDKGEVGRFGEGVRGGGGDCGVSVGSLESKVMRKCCFVVERDALLRGEFTLSSLDVLQEFSFLLQMGFTLILATLDGLDVGLLGDVIGEDDFDNDS